MPDTDTTTTPVVFLPDQRVLVQHHARMVDARSNLTWHDDGSPVPATVITGPDTDGDYRVQDEDGNTTYVAARYLSRPEDEVIEDVTLTMTSAPTTPVLVNGGRYLLDVGADMSDRSGVFYGHTEPLPVMVHDVTDTLNNGADINVRRLDSVTADPQTQFVALRYLTPMPEETVSRVRDAALGDIYRITAEGTHGFPVGTLVSLARAGGPDDPLIGGNSAYMTTTGILNQPTWQQGVTAFVDPSRHVEFVSAAQPVPEPVPEPEPVAEHESTPQWAVQECTHGHPGLHYHVTSGGTAFDPNRHVMYNGHVHEAGGFHTEQGVRYARGETLETALAEQRSREAAALLADPEPEPDLPPPEEVLRRLTERDDIAPEVRRRRSIERITGLLQQITEARAAVDSARYVRADWVNRLIGRSREVADEQEWCGVYDRAMEELGLPTRHDREEEEPETENVTVSATIEISVTFDDNDFDAWFADRHGTSISSRSNSARFTFTIDVDHDATVTEGECACDEGECACDEDIEWENVLPDWVADNGYDWDIENRSCSND